jgi:hypothetical protein
MRAVLVLAFALPTLAACASPPPPLPPPAPPTPPPPAIVTAAKPATPAPPPATCPGTVEVVSGLKEITALDDKDADELYKQAVYRPAKGGLCTAKVYEVVKPVTVYRVWNKAKPNTQLGRWWSFTRPSGPIDAYRSANAICPEWSDLDVVSECKLKVGARVVVGPGQSATCAKTAYPSSAVNQVFVPNDTRDPKNQKVFVEGCTAGASWP